MIKLLLVIFLSAGASAATCNLSRAKKVKFTNYWVAVEGSFDYDNNGNRIELTGPKTVSLKSCDGKVLAKSNKKFADKCSLEGTCRLQDGRTLNVGDNMKCFVVLDSRNPWGVGNRDNALVPMVSVASNDIPFGTKLKIKELVNKRLPNGKVHNGCVRVDDTCSTCQTACDLDFMVGKIEYYEQLRTPDEVTAVVDKNCKILNYGI